MAFQLVIGCEVRGKTETSEQHTIVYMAAVADTETKHKFDEMLYADVVVEEWVMQDLWSSVRIPDLRFLRINLTFLATRW